MLWSSDVATQALTAHICKFPQYRNIAVVALFLRFAQVDANTVRSRRWNLPSTRPFSESRNMRDVFWLVHSGVKELRRRRQLTVDIALALHALNLPLLVLDTVLSFSAAIPPADADVDYLFIDWRLVPYSLRHDSNAPTLGELLFWTDAEVWEVLKTIKFWPNVDTSAKKPLIRNFWWTTYD